MRSKNKYSKKSSTTQKTNNVTGKAQQRWHKKLLIIASIILLVFVAAGILLWKSFSYDKNATVYTSSVAAPTESTFTDDNYMLFSTKSDIPDVNNDRSLTPASNLIISYSLKSGDYAPVFNMNITDADLINEVKISPFIRGNWRFLADNSLLFTPETPWPADTKFTVKINKDLFNKDVKIGTNKVSFKTPEITAKVDSFNVYSAPNDKKSVIGIAVISFNYEINTKDFKDKISLKIDDEKLDFSVKFDRFHRTAFITSAPVSVTTEPQIMRLKLNRVPALDGKSDTKKITANLTIEASDNIFKVASLSTVVVNDNDGNAQQLILANTTVAAKSEKDLSNYMSVYLLPEFYDDEEKQNDTPHDWKADEVTDKVLSESKEIKITPTNFATPKGIYQYAYSYDVSESTKRYLYVSIKAGAESKSGFEMKNGLNTIMQVPYPAPSVTIAGSGALLSLSGDQKLGLVAQGGVKTAYVNLYKVKTEEVNHLISQTYNIFSPDIEFKSWSFGVYDMSVIFQKRISFANSSMKRNSYASLDLGDYLDRTYNDNTGIFVIQTGFSENSAEYNDKRLILLTDLGIIRKTNLDETSDVFVSNLSSGLPAKDVKIDVLGRNGNAVWSGLTDKNGHVEIPAFPWSEYRNAKEPVAIVARQKNDISFIPYNAYNQQVEYSKFDIDGTYQSSMTPLNAYIFSDRGIYRPGEQVVLSGIVKNKSFKSLSGIPVRLQVRDSMGKIVIDKSFSLTADGMFDIKHTISEDSGLGTWNAYLYSLNSNGTLDDMLGSAYFEVQEFVPDTMEINANIVGKSQEGWLALNNVKANVSLRNLFGTPATDKRISVTATLTPADYSFDEFKGYVFTPNFISGTGLADGVSRYSKTYTEELPDLRTDDNGNAEINVKLQDNIPDGTYILNLSIQGFEADSGKSVQTNVSTRASDAKYLIGWKASADLDYINKNSERKINIVAVDHTGKQASVDGLKLLIIKKEEQTSLVKDYSNNYKYQTVSHEEQISEQNINISESGYELSLDTKNAGNYVMRITDAADKVLANAEYYVIDDKNQSMTVDTPAELKIKLNKQEYKSGEDIAINITAPYAGAGLITIERDKIYAYKWFKMDTTSSVQRITIPKGFEGTGYINVSFVRDIKSKDIFTSPYAYAVEPFSSDVSSHKIDINIDAPKKISGNELEIKYSTNKDAKIMIFAINEGILQVAKYNIPNPISYFFQKAALQVNTYQILSLLLPEYNILKEYAKTGGGDYYGDGALKPILKNPFGRKQQPSVAFYSGIKEVKANTSESVKFVIPEYFDGTLRVFAVAANTDAVGSNDTEVVVQSPLIISTSVPAAVAPEDTFKINTVISNLTEEDTATNAKIEIKSTGGIEIKDQQEKETIIPVGSEKLVKFDAAVKDNLGNSEINITAKMLNDKGAITAERTSQSNISVRPVTPYTTNIISGKLSSDSVEIRKLKRDFYKDFASQRLYISGTNSAMALPLVEFLSKYEYPCTEQLVSTTIPYVLMPEDDFLGTSYEDSSKKISTTINTLKNRQNEDGSFNLWSETYNEHSYQNQMDADTVKLTAYVVEFLTLAKNSGFSIPEDMLSRGIGYLRTFAGETITNNEYAAAAAQAIYVISENGYVTTSYIDNFVQYANEHIKGWESELIGAYIASAYKLLKQDDLADKLIKKYEISKDADFENYGIFDSNVSDDAMYFYLTNKYFSQSEIGESDLIQSYIKSGYYSTYPSATIIMALADTRKEKVISLPDINIKTDSSLAVRREIKNNAIVAEIPLDATNIEITCKTCDEASSLTYTLLQQGYQKESASESNGIEIIREYYDSNDKRITSGNIGDIITVKIFVRTRGGVDNIDDVVISDLLPGGFIPETDSIVGDANFWEIREDRVLIYTNLNRTEKIFQYKAQLGTEGSFRVPPINAEAMYNPQIKATGDVGSFTVVNATN